MCDPNGLNDARLASPHAPEVKIAFSIAQKEII